MSEEFHEKALEYHREGKPGKIDSLSYGEDYSFQNHSIQD